MRIFIISALALVVAGPSVALAVIWFRASRGVPRAPKLPQAPRPGATFTIGGRRFRRIERASLMLDEHVHNVLLAAGIAEPELKPREQPGEYLDRIYAALHQAKADRPLVAAILRPEGEPEPSDEAGLSRVCEETARFLGTLDGERDKTVFRTLLAEILRPFSLSGLPSWLRARASSAAPPVSPAASPSRRLGSPAAAGATGRG